MAITIEVLLAIWACSYKYTQINLEATPYIRVLNLIILFAYPTPKSRNVTKYKKEFSLEANAMC